MKKMALDVGCGNSPKGDVNCDLYVGKTSHLMSKNNLIDPRRIPNFVRCSAEYLPFQDNVFDIVNASELMEHIVNPPFLLAEMKRVSREVVTLDVPNLRRLFPEENPNHIYTWSSKSLMNLLSLFFSEVVLTSSVYGTYIPSKVWRYDFLAYPLKFLEYFMQKLLGPPFLKAICKV